MSYPFQNANYSLVIILNDITYKYFNSESKLKKLSDLQLNAGKCHTIHVLPTTTTYICVYFFIIMGYYFPY